MDYVDINSIKNILKDSKLRQCKCNTNSKVLNELNLIISELDSHMKSCNIEKTSNWIIYHNTWLNNENHKLNHKFYNYSRGDIILSIDFGTVNIGTEIRYPHPCVVLFDNDEDWVIVAPITAAQLDENNNPIIHKPFEILINKSKSKPLDPKEFYFVKDSVIQVDQIQRISKFRAVNKTSLKIRTDLLNQIDNVILENYTPLKYKLLEKLKNVNSELSNIIKIKDEENKKLEEENKMLKETIMEYKNLLKQIEVTSE